VPMENEISSRFRGCILGLVVGDALGMPWEFMSPQEIHDFWNGEDFARGRAQPDLESGQYTDDTMSMRCLLESLASCRGLDIDDFQNRLIEWYRSGDLRGIGANSLTAIQMLERGEQLPDTPLRGSRGATNGAAMRVAPLGLFFCEDEDGLRDAVRLASEVTHRHPEALAGAMAVSFSVARSVLGEVPADELMAEASRFTAPSGVSRQLEFAQRLLERGTDCAGAIRELGNSAYAVESVPAALFCACRHPTSYDDAVVAAIRGGGDTDTVGSMAGAVAGARLGLPAIPDRWVTEVEDSEALLQAADRLFGVWQVHGR